MKADLLDLTDDLGAAAESVEKTFGDAYPDLDQLAEPADADTNDEPEGMTRSGKSAKSITTKIPPVERPLRTDSLRSVVREAAEFLAEHQACEKLTRQEKAAVAYHAKTLGDLARPSDSVTDGDELTAEDRKALANLERQIARRERLPARLNTP